MEVYWGLHEVVRLAPPEDRQSTPHRTVDSGRAFRDRCGGAPRGGRAPYPPAPAHMSLVAGARVEGARSDKTHLQSRARTSRTLPCP